MAKIGLPQIDIEFIQKAVSAIDRSERGIALILCIDEKASAVTKKVYCYETEIVADDYSADNLAAIKRAFLVPVNKVYVISAPTGSVMSTRPHSYVKLSVKVYIEFENCEDIVICCVSDDKL